MKKYFQIGKEYLTKKLQQLEQKVPTDYLTQQIPPRLRQPLQVLQSQDIDIEDGQVYQNYFKCYPNHHLSHFLLDKYNMMVEGGAQPSKYILPNETNNFVPTYNQQLQQKALLLREAIQQYDEGFSKNDEPIVCISVINFHHKRGTQVQYRYPEGKSNQHIEQSIVHHAMPDSSHNKHEDYNFFNFEAEIKGKRKMLFGVSYFKQIKLTEEMKKQNPQFTRSYLQKAVALVSTVPIFGYIKVKLSITTKVFFQKFTSFQIIQDAYKDISKHLMETWPTLPVTDLYIGSDLKTIIPLFEIENFYQVWKAILYQKRVVIFGHSSSSVSSFVLSILSLFPGLSTFGIFSKPIAKYMQSLRELALPLRLFSSENFLYFSFHIQDFHLLQKFKKSTKGNFLIGTTNRLLKQSNQYGIQMLVNLENCTVESRTARRPWQGLSKKQVKFLKQLKQLVNNSHGSVEDSIRNLFHNFLKKSLTEIIAGCRAFENFTKECENYSSQNFEGQNEKKFPPLFPQETKKMVFAQLLLQKSFAYFRQFKNQSFPEIVKGKIFPSLYINNYDYFLTINKEEFVSYNWIQKKLSFGKGENHKNFEGKQIKFKGLRDQDYNQLVKSVFVGNIEQGKFNKNGFYLDQSEIFQGQYVHGVKNGYGKLLLGGEKYIGDFVDGVYEGQGQLLIGKDVYVGQFKNGHKSGYGSMHGTYVFEGIWQNDCPIAPKQELKQELKDDKLVLNAKQGSISIEAKEKQRIKNDQ